MRGRSCPLPKMAALVLVISSCVLVESFAPPMSKNILTATTTSQCHRDGPEWQLYESSSSDNGSVPNHLHDDHVAETSSSDVHRIKRVRGIVASLLQKSKPVALALVSVTAFGQKTILRPPAAEASAPIVLRAAKKKDDPPMVQAAKKAEELKKQRSIEEFDRFMEKCNDIEMAEGKQARDEYEAQYQAEKQAREAQKLVDIENLKRELLDEGQDPSTDLDAERKVWLFEHDIDLDKIPGTPHNEQMIKNFQSRGKNTPTYASQRFIIKCQVADLKARGVDPMEHFAQPEVMEKTRAIYKMDDKLAAKVAEQYEGLMEQYGGRLTPPQAGEVHFVYKSSNKVSNAAVAVAATQSKAEVATAKAKAKEEAAAAKAKARENKAVAKAQAKAKRAAERAQAKKEKQAQRQARADAKAQAKAANAEKASQEALDSEMAATAGMDFAATAGVEASAEDTAVESSVSSSQEVSSTDNKNVMDMIKSKANAKNAATVIIAGGATVYGYNYITENSAGAQAERERQLKLIMGETDDDEDEEDDDDFDDDDDDFDEPISKPKAAQPSPAPAAASKPKVAPPPPAPVPAPKRRLGLFNKNKDARETNLNTLLAPDAQAPEFAGLLAKILTYGAPGRFPAISSDMPFKEFDLDTAKELLTQSRGDADLADEQSAEIFASVVNCMIIDIVDLASSTVKGKDSDDKITVDAIGVVMDFMDHAAALFDAVASDVTIKPVTYGGSLRKKDLEKMFSIYAGSSMMSLDGKVTQDRVDTLQLVFGITDKKAEGLMQKHTMKMMMNLMKDGGKGLEGMPGMEGLEGMEDMMSALGGGMPGMPGMDGEMSPEDLKQTVGMMKELMDSGAVSEEELAEVRSQFKEMYGSDIADLIKKADEEGAGASMSDDERALLDMFKQILGE